MIKTFLLTITLLLLVAAQCFACDIDQINSELHNDPAITRPITTDSDTQNKGWNNWDTGLLVLRVADWGQTNWNSSKNWIEQNPILGEFPSSQQVNTYFVALIGCDLLISKYSNPTVHKWWNVIQITAETYCVIHNWQLGVGFKF